MAQSLGRARGSRTGAGNRAIASCASGLLSLWVVGADVATVQASATIRRSELLTPIGWEPPVGDRPSAPGAEDELLVPIGWGDGSSDAARGQWGGSLCSELVVPADWARTSPR
jgi:hypothetical protein